MESLADDAARPQQGFSSALRGVSWLAGVVVAGLAGLAAALVAIVLATALAIIAVMTGALIALGSLAFRARRPSRARGDKGVIEARHVGGHSWVAYGWDQQGR